MSAEGADTDPVAALEKMEAKYKTDLKRLQAQYEGVAKKIQATETRLEVCKEAITTARKAVANARKGESTIEI